MMMPTFNSFSHPFPPLTSAPDPLCAGGVHLEPYRAGPSSLAEVERPEDDLLVALDVPAGSRLLGDGADCQVAVVVALEP